jgi:hypothetical protein
MNEQVLNLMKKELVRLEKAYEKAKEKTEQIRSAPEKMIALLRKAQAMTQDKTLSAMQLIEKLKSMESENNRLRKLLGMDYCGAVDTISQQTEKRQRTSKLNNHVNFTIFTAIVKSPNQTTNDKKQATHEALHKQTQNITMEHKTPYLTPKNPQKPPKNPQRNPLLTK